MFIKWDKHNNDCNWINSAWTAAGTITKTTDIVSVPSTAKEIRCGVAWMAGMWYGVPFTFYTTISAQYFVMNGTTSGAYAFGYISYDANQHTVGITELYNAAAISVGVAYR